MKAKLLVKYYSVNGCEFEITTRLNVNSDVIVTVVQCTNSNIAEGFQINTSYINCDKLTEHYDNVYEKCEAIAERISGWNNVVEMLIENRFELIETKSK